MPMSTERKQRLGEAMRRTAEANTCPVCKRRSAIANRLIGERYRLWCIWIDRGKCTSTPENDTRQT